MSKLWASVRRINKETFQDLQVYLNTGVNTRHSKGEKQRLKRWAQLFKFENGKLILKTSEPQFADINFGNVVKTFYVVTSPIVKEEIIKKMVSEQSDW